VSLAPKLKLADSREWPPVKGRQKRKDDKEKERGGRVVKQKGEENRKELTPIDLRSQNCADALGPKLIETHNYRRT